MAGVRHGGLDPRTALARWGLAAVAVGIVAGATGPAAVSGVAALVERSAEGLPWLLERVFAFLAYLALTGSVVYGLLLSTKLLDAIAHRPVSYALHRDLAAFGVGMAGIHGMLLGLDRTLPFSLVEILVPGRSPHAPLAVAAGQVALYLMLAVTGSFYVRHRIGQRAWRLLHYVTFLSFAGATIHGIASGTDSAVPWARALYLGAVVAVVFLLGYRIASALLARRIGRGGRRVEAPWARARVSRGRASGG